MLPNKTLRLFRPDIEYALMTAGLIYIDFKEEQITSSKRIFSVLVFSYQHLGGYKFRDLISYFQLSKAGALTSLWNNFHNIFLTHLL